MADVNVIVEQVPAEKPANKQAKAPAKKKSTNQQAKAPAKKSEEQPDIMEKLAQLSRDVRATNTAVKEESKVSETRYNALMDLERSHVSKLDAIEGDLKTLKEWPSDLEVLADASKEQILLARAIKKNTERILVSQGAIQKDLDDLKKANKPIPAIVWLTTVVAFLIVGIIARVAKCTWIDTLVWAIMAAAATVIIIVIIAVTTDTGGKKKEKKDDEEDDA